MCGIAGLMSLDGDRPLPDGSLAAMAAALVHRGPDEEGFLEEPGLGLASRRLSIVGLADGRQPITNEDGSVAVVFNGEIFEYPELRAELEGRGHHFATHCDTEVIPHLWEELHEHLFTRLRGQFALALWDRRRRQLILARDRVGICPLYWSRHRTPAGDWLLFASEIKGLLASGLVSARPDPRGLDHLFTFFATPGPVTCFQDVQLLLPGHYLSICPGTAGAAARCDDRTYWLMDYPDGGEELDGRAPAPLASKLEALLLAATERRLRADVPVAAYLSGGVDSSLVVALASHLKARPLPTFTIQVKAPHLDESQPALAAARTLGAEPCIVPCGAEEILAAYPQLIQAAECPVSDTCCAALLLLAREVHAQGFKVVLTGEGADEGLAGYPWYKLQKLLDCLDVVPGLPVSRWLRRAYLRLSGMPCLPPNDAQRMLDAVGQSNAWLNIYAMTGLAKQWFFGPRLRAELKNYSAWEDLRLPAERLRRWHPLNRSLAVGMRVHLPGLLLSTGGDRVAMHSAVESRYPFLDEDVVAYLASLAPGWKLNGLREKYLLRVVAERWLPRALARRPKRPFRAPFDLLAREPAPAFVGQLLSDESLRRTDYFDVAAVRHWRRAYRHLRPDSGPRLAVELGLSAVVATQLWHHLFIDGHLSELCHQQATGVLAGCQAS